MGFRRLAATVVLTPCLAAAQRPTIGTDFAGTASGLSTTSVVVCAAGGAGPSVGTYELCALRNDGLVVRQGATGLVVARPGAFRGFALTPLVAGDSALAYARIFERQELRAREFRLAAGAIMLGSGFVLLSRHGVEQHGGFRADKRIPIALSLQAVGLALTFPASIYSRRATQSLSTSLWWNNSRFAR